MERLPEINVSFFVQLLQPFYDILEGKKSISKPDLFEKQSWMMFYDLSEDEWIQEQKKIQIKRAWTMEWGNFHQKLMGSFPGWENYGNGHSTGCDIGNEQCVVEIKNNINTMNSSSKESVIRKLKIQKDLGKRAILVIINGDIKNHTDEHGIEWINGKTFYQELAGRPFMDDLIHTVKDCFSTYKTYHSLKTSLENPLSVLP
jgi:hypothetical protein